MDVKLTMLGTGSAMALECFNTCFIIEDKGELFMVDGGGGNMLFSRIEKAGYDWKDIKHIFVTHKHMDHLFGIIWMVRMITQHMQRGQYDGEAYIYASDEVIDIIMDFASRLLLQREIAFIGKRLHLVEIKDGQAFSVLGKCCTAFDIRSTKTKQFGFTMSYTEGKRLTCCGDEPCSESGFKYAEGSEWLLHEAFCLYSQADIFSPYEKHHSTVKDACELAERAGVKNLLLYHTEDRNISNRKRLYTEEGSRYYSGNLIIPDDLEVIEII